VLGSPELIDRIDTHVVKTAARRADFKNIAHDPLANPRQLVQLLDEASEKNWRGWLPETVRKFCELSKDDVLQLDKLMACQVVLTNLDAFDEWPLFLACCSAFNHRRANFEWLDQPSFLEAAWTCHVFRTLRPNHSFGPGVLRFLSALMVEDGLAFFPWVGGDGLRADNEYLQGLTNCSDLADETKKVWDAGVLVKADMPDEINDSDPLHVQAAKLIAGQLYIKAQDN
jgi:hypothetical protein